MKAKEYIILICISLLATLLYYSDNESDIDIFTSDYIFDNNKNVNEHSSTRGDYIDADRYELDKCNGIYKHVNLPFWFISFQLLFVHEPLEHLYNNAKEVLFFSRSSETFTSYGTNYYEYNSYGYPVEKIFRPSMELVGIWGSNTKIELYRCKTKIEKNNNHHHEISIITT